ncbi:MAG TPA: cysteine hydrolase [Candidatus Angelobacter sp.]|jgi:nicotinamidase-related amidase
MKHAFGLNIPQTLKEACDPLRMALLVYDMQVGIVSQIKNGEQITGRVVQVLQAARTAGVRIFFSRHLSLPKELMGVTQLRMTLAWQRVDSVEQIKPWFLRDSPPFQLIPEVAPLNSEAVFDKIAMSAFEGTLLNTALHDCGINRVAIVGVAMEIGIEPTVRHAVDLGYIPIVVTDACGAGHEEAAKRSVTALEFAGDAFLTNVETICRVLAEKAGSR